MNNEQEPCDNNLLLALTGSFGARFAPRLGDKQAGKAKVHPGEPGEPGSSP